MPLPNSKPKKEWKDMTKAEKATGIIILIVLALIVIGIIGAFTDKNKDNNAVKQPQASKINNQSDIKIPVEEKSAKEKMVESINGLINSKKAFDTGSYVKGDIPIGEYAFVSFSGSGKYFSEEDSAGNIIDNENFDSFGYVYVHGAGNLETQGVLIKIKALKSLGVKGAKEIYEQLNETKNYKGSGWYKVGSDIKAGSYTIKSLGEAYVAVLSGPVGNNEIVNNNNFNGRYSVSVTNGQYLNVSRGEIQ